MLTDEECRGCVEGLLNAARTGRPIPPLTLAFPALTVAEAYRIQRRWLDARLGEGARPVGYKIGLTSRAMQALFQATEPMYGRILDDGVLQDGARVRAGSFCKPRLEVELAFVLAADLEGPEVSIERVLEATERVVPAFEIVAQRTEASRSLADAIADNGAHGAIVLGRRGFGPREMDLACISAVLHRNGACAEAGVSSAVMDHPAAAVAWLARRLAVAGERLSKGQVILSGTLTRALEVSAGDCFRAEYEATAVALGAIEVSFD